MSYIEGIYLFNVWMSELKMHSPVYARSTHMFYFCFCFFSAADSAGFLKIQNILVSYKRLRKLNKNHCKRVTGKIKKMEKTVSALQNELREAKDVTSRLEHQKAEWEHEVCSLRYSISVLKKYLNSLLLDDRCVGAVL